MSLGSPQEPTLDPLMEFAGKELWASNFLMSERQEA